MGHMYLKFNDISLPFNCTVRQRDLIEFEIHMSHFMIHIILFIIRTIQSPKLYIKRVT